MDSGTQYDLISDYVASMFPDSVHAMRPIRLNTANGLVHSSRGLRVQFPKLGDVESSAYILKTTPAAASIGKRVHGHGLQLLVAQRL